MSANCSMLPIPVLRYEYIVLNVVLYYPLQKGIPYDDKERWRVFADPSSIDVSLLPEPIIPDEEEEAKEGDEKGKKGGLLGLF